MNLSETKLKSFPAPPPSSTKPIKPPHFDTRLLHLHRLALSITGIKEITLIEGINKKHFNHYSGDEQWCGNGCADQCNGPIIKYISYILSVTEITIRKGENIVKKGKFPSDVIQRLTINSVCEFKKLHCGSLKINDA